ncbi:MAG: hypothetical protein ACRECX_00205 [Methyloceanibacter sp.]|uniref:hypothetical protein n=1 Tax=Methyloceanibacter sp. TaxID=1965321 RepID=UPI003D6D1734
MKFALAALIGISVVLATTVSNAQSTTGTGSTGAPPIRTNPGLIEGSPQSLQETNPSAGPGLGYAPYPSFGVTPGTPDAPDIGPTPLPGSGSTTTPGSSGTSSGG